MHLRVGAAVDCAERSGVEWTRVHARRRGRMRTGRVFAARAQTEAVAQRESRQRQRIAELEKHIAVLQAGARPKRASGKAAGHSHNADCALDGGSGGGWGGLGRLW
eukprot:5248762-Pleurochrysis_carterae.AAC.2